MTFRFPILIFAFVIFALMMACGTTAPATQSVPGAQETSVALGVLATQNVFIQQTLDAAAITATAGVSLPPAAIVSPPPEPTREQQPLSLPTMEPVSIPTLAPAASLAPLESGGQKATQQAQPMADLIQKLYDSQQIRNNAGSFYSFKDIDQTWFDPKQPGFIGLNDSPKDLSSYIIRGRAAWRAPGNIEKPERTGCGFVYGYSGMYNYHTTFLAQDQIVHTLRSRGNEFIEMKGGFFQGGLGSTADLMLIVEDKMMSFYVNDIEVVRFRDPYMETGKVAAAILSGSPQGFSCKITEIQLWAFE